MLFTLSFFFIVFEASAKDRITACQRQFRGEETLSRCELRTPKLNAEVVKLSKTCSRNFNAPKQDCYTIRICPKYTNQKPHQAPQLFERDFNSSSHYCKNPGYIFLRDDPHKFQATALCEGATLKAVTLRIGGQSIDCPFEW